MRDTDYIEYITICNVHMLTDQVYHIQPTDMNWSYLLILLHIYFTTSSLLQVII